MDVQTSSDNKVARKSFTAALQGWLIRVGLLTPPYGDADEQQRTDPEVQKARRWREFHNYDLPRYRR
jgi:hypothetical protein